MLSSCIYSQEDYPTIDDANFKGVYSLMPLELY